MRVNYKSLLLLFGLGLLAVCSAPFAVLAHGDLHERIQALTQSIQSNPTNADLFLKRGELQRLHGEPSLAIADFQRALDLNPALDLAALGLARSWLDAGKPWEAKPLLDSFLAHHPQNAEALLVRARVLAKLGQHRAAAMDYTGALGAMSVPLPDIYLERAAVLAESGSIDAAISSLDEGVSRLGRLAPLELRAVDLELGRKHYDAALNRLNAQIEAAPRKEFLLSRRAAILEEAGRPDEAYGSYLRAANALQTLPPERRATPALRELERRIEAALVRLKPATDKRLANGGGN